MLSKMKALSGGLAVVIAVIAALVSTIDVSTKALAARLTRIREARAARLGWHDAVRLSGLPALAGGSGTMLDELQIDQVLGYFAAGQTKRTSSILDMAGYDGVIFVAGLGTIIQAGTLDVFVEQNDANQTSGMARLATTTAHTVTAANAALTQSCIVVEVYRPQERYLQCNITPAAQNAVILGVVAIRYKAGVLPRTQAANVLKSTQLVSPAEA